MTQVVEDLYKEQVVHAGNHIIDSVLEYGSEEGDSRDAGGKLEAIVERFPSDIFALKLARII